jgi:hypothetical protein
LKIPRSPLCARKIKGLTENSQKLARIYVIEITRVIYAGAAKWRKNAGGKNEGNLHYVIENKWSKNVRNWPLHYVIEK